MVEKLTGSLQSPDSGQSVQSHGIFSKVKGPDLEIIAKQTTAEKLASGELRLSQVGSSESIAEFNPVVQQQPQSDSFSLASSSNIASSSYNLVSSDATNKQQPLVPALNLPGAKTKNKRGQSNVVKTVYELELEKQSNQVVKGPLEKEWNNYGIPLADDSTQLINIQKQLGSKKSQKIKETVNVQVHDVIEKKRGWAYYEKHQPDYASFQAEIKKTIMTLLSPAVTENTKNGIRLDDLIKDQQAINKRMEEVEFVYKRVVKNASAQQDALTDLETRSKALRVTEERLREQVKHCEGIKNQLSDKFKLLRDDRKVIMERLDNVDNEVNQYRRDIRVMHDQISASVFEKLKIADARSLENTALFEEMTRRLDHIVDRHENVIEVDFREQSTQLGKLQEQHIQQRQQLINLDKAIVTEFDWRDKNRIYDHTISLLSAKHNEIDYEFQNVKEFLNTTHKQDIQAQIDTTIQAVLGDRKKYMKLLKDYQGKFYDGEQESQDSNDVDSNGNKIPALNKTSFKDIPKKGRRSKIRVDSQDSDSDNSLERMKGYLEKLQTSGQLSIPGLATSAAGGGALVSNQQVVEMMKQQEEEKLEKVRQKYVQKMPIRRQGRYSDIDNLQFCQQKNTKLRQLNNKQIASQDKLSLIISNARRHSGTGSGSDSLKRTSRFSVNRFKSNETLNSGIPPGLSLEERKAKLQRTFDIQMLESDRPKISELFKALKNKHKFAIASELCQMLAIHNGKHEVHVLQVKHKTISVAVLAYKDDKEYQMTMNEIAAVAQVLSLTELTDLKGNIVKSNYQEKKRGILARVVELEEKHRGESSSQNSSQASRHADVRLHRPMIAVESQNSDQPSRRSKTMLPERRESMIQVEKSRSSSSSLKRDATLPQECVSQDVPQTATMDKNKLYDLKSVKDSKSKRSQSSSDSLQKSASRVKLALQHINNNEENSVSSKASDIASPKGSKEKDKIDSKAGQGKRQSTKSKQSNINKATNKTARTRGKRTIPTDYGVEESFEYPDDNSGFGDGNTNGVESNLRMDDDDGLFPDEAEVPSTDMILLKMKDQIDACEDMLKERTGELRELSKYVKKLEVSIVKQFETQFSMSYAKMDYHVADIKELIGMRMNIVSSKLVKNNQVIAAQKENGANENFAIQRQIKVITRALEQRIVEVNEDHQTLNGKYSYLVHCNDYFAKLAEQVITVTELNSCLLTADEKDKDTISLMGGKFHRTLGEAKYENHLNRLQQQIDELERSDVGKTGSGGTPVNADSNNMGAFRPNSGESHVSQRSQITGLKKGGKVDPEEDLPIIQIDKRCQTCSDSKGQILQLFKIACLSYFPSRVVYRGCKYPKRQLIQLQEDHANSLRKILNMIGANLNFNPLADNMSNKFNYEEKDIQRTIDEDDETQLNSDRQGENVLSSEGFSKKLGAVCSSNNLDSLKDQSNKPGFSDVDKKSVDSRRPNDNKKASAKVGQASAIQSSLKKGIQVKPYGRKSPIDQIETIKRTERSLTPQRTFDGPASNNIEQVMSETRVVPQASFSHLRSNNTDRESQSNIKDPNQRPLSKRVSFDQGQPTSPLSQAAALSYQTQQLKLQQQQQQQQQHQAPPHVPGQHTSFRFNATHELLAFNQEQIAKIVPNPVSNQQNTTAQLGGGKVDEKLLQIQKLKEKALMIQISREVNRPNGFVAPRKSSSKTPKALNSMHSGEFFPTKEQMEYARGVARIKNNNETKIMLDTRERFTRRFQFDKLSHQMMENTPSATQISGSAHNELERYDSRTVFRQVRKDPTEMRIPQNYANLIGNKSPSLPNLTRNHSANQPGAFSSAEVVFSQDQADNMHQRIRKTRNQRPISSMQEQTQPVWRMSKGQDGRSMVILNQRRLKDLDWNAPRQSNGTEQINQMLGATNRNLSSANFSSQ